MRDLTLAWHFVNGTLRDGSPIPPDGKWLHYEGECVMCESGLHASRRIIDALEYAPSNPTVCRVACARIVDKAADKFVCRSRFILWRLDAQEAIASFVKRATEASWATARASFGTGWSSRFTAAYKSFNDELEAMILDMRGNPDDAYLLTRVP